MVWTGLTALASPSWATAASLRHCTLVSLASVATTPIVVCRIAATWSRPGPDAARQRGSDLGGDRGQGCPLRRSRDAGDRGVVVGHQSGRPEFAGAAVVRGPGGIADHQRGDRRAVRQECARLSDPTLQPAGAGSGPGTDTAFGEHLGSRRGLRGTHRVAAEGGVRAGLERAAAGQVEDHRGRDDRHHVGRVLPHRKPDTGRAERIGDPGRGGQSVGRAAGQDERVDPLDGRPRVQQVGLAGPRGTAADVHPGDHAAGGSQDHRRTGQPTVGVGRPMADPQPGHVDQPTAAGGGAHPRLRSGWPPRRTPGNTAARRTPRRSRRSDGQSTYRPDRRRRCPVRRPGSGWCRR